MAAPKIPGHTCPLIDKVQKTIERAFKIADHGRLPGFDTEKPKENKLSAQISRLRLAANKTETELFA